MQFAFQGKTVQQEASFRKGADEKNVSSLCHLCLIE